MTKFSNPIMQFAYSTVSSGLLTDVYDHAVCSIIDHNIDSTRPIYVAKSFSKSASSTIIAFVPSPTTLVEENFEGDLVDFPNSNFQEFEFICTKKNPSVSINKTAFDLFVFIKDELSREKDEIDIKSPLIITGVSVGGSIASLFTLWLLDTIYLKASKKPLCITFGSPLLGNDAFQKAISEHPTWISCFLNVISNKDSVPRLLAFGDYMPFGTTLILSESDCLCFDEPQSVLDLIKEMILKSPAVDFDNCDYRGTLKRLEHNVIRKPEENVKCDIKNPLKAGITLQLFAIGAISKEEINSEKGSLITQIVETQTRMINDNPQQKISLSDVKVSMAQMEWYKKNAEKDGGCYYDSYKTVFTRSRETIIRHQRTLTKYWEGKVDEVEKMPKREAQSKILSRWLHGGTNYRRMVEPLEIAEYYMVEGNTDYINKKRSEHFKLLDEWDKASTHKPAERNKVSSLTEDSCFWARVEEAIIVLDLLMKGGHDRESLVQSLLEFEVYVMGLIKKLVVSVEIFNKKSSFMKWWNRYKDIKITSSNSELMAFMNNNKLENKGFVLDDYKMMA